MVFEKDIEKSLEILRNGGVILYPTDTIWGIGCDASNEEAVARIYQIKKRPESKSMIVLLAEAKDIIKYVAHPDPAIFEFLENTQKPTTVVYDGAIGLAENLLADDGSVGIRVVKDDFCRHLIKRLRRPIVSTSANVSGEPSPTHFAAISPEIKASVDYVVRYRQEEVANPSPSSVVRWNNGELIIIRP